jgi:hypothetical protein
MSIKKGGVEGKENKGEANRSIFARDKAVRSGP